MSNSFATPWIIACQAPLSMGFLRQEELEGTRFLLQGLLLNPGTKLCLLHWQANSFPLNRLESPQIDVFNFKCLRVFQLIISFFAQAGLKYL